MISIWTDPVFRVRRLDGGIQRMGLKETLMQAHTCRDLIGRTPTGRIALLRLILAFLEDSLQPEDMDARRDLYESGAFDMEAIEKYVEACEAAGPRFLLDDEKHPFMQAAYDPELDAKAEKPVAALVMDVPSGNNHVHFDHRTEWNHELNASEAFEALLETYLFCPSGTAGPSNVNNTPPVYFLLMGENLFQTLVLNMVSREELDPIPFGEGAVPWRSSAVIHPNEEIKSVSFLQAFTWRPRRAKLNFDAEGNVSTCFLQPGLDFKGDKRWYDPHAAYSQKKDQSYRTLKPEPGRQIWRDIGSILKGQGRIQPMPVANQSNIREDLPNSLVRVEAVGLQTNNASLLGWTHETMNLPNAFLEDADKAEDFRSCIGICETLVKALAKTIDKQLEFGKNAKRKGSSQLSEQACTLSLQLMHDELFGKTQQRIVQNDRAWRAGFAEAVICALKRVQNEVINHSGTTIERMRRQDAVCAVMRACANKELKGWR